MTGIEPALSAWELACYASATLIIGTNYPKPVHASNRQIPPPPLLSGTERARGLSAPTVVITCLQSTCTLSVTVAGLGLSFFRVGLNRPLSGLVVVRCSGQPNAIKFVVAIIFPIRNRRTW